MLMQKNLVAQESPLYIAYSKNIVFLLTNKKLVCFILNKKEARIITRPQQII